MSSNHQLVHKTQRKHQRARATKEAAAIGAVYATLLAPLSHGTSLFSLLFTIPKILYYTYKQDKYRSQLRLHGAVTLPRRKRDLAIPLAVGGLTAAIGAGTPGLEHVQHGAEHIAQQMSGQHVDGARLLIDGVRDALVEHVSALENPTRDLHDGMQNMWMQWNMDEPHAYHAYPDYDGVNYGADHDAYGGLDEKITSLSYEDMAHHHDGAYPEADFFQNVSLGEQHIEDAFERMNEIIAEVMNGTFVQNEMQAIGKNLTAAALGEILSWIMSSPLEDESSSTRKGQGEDSLKQKFHDIIMSSVREIEYQRDLVTALRRSKGGDVVKVPSTSGSALSTTSSVESFKQSATCFICLGGIIEEVYICWDCTEFLVCVPCFKQQGPCLHAGHTFGCVRIE